MMTNKVKFEFDYYAFHTRDNTTCMYYRFNTRNNDFEYLFNKSWHSSQYETVDELWKELDIIRGVIIGLPSWSFLKPEEIFMKIDKLIMIKELKK